VSSLPKPLRVTFDAGSITAQLYEAGAPEDAVLRPPAERALLVLAHGAGAGQHSPFMVDVARGLASLGVDTITFDFLYSDQKRRVPDRRPVLESCYRAVVETVRREADHERPMFIGGKSMGGRIATHVAAADPSLRLAGLVLLGYPLHPPGRPEQRRDAHLPAIGRPMLFVQGSRDTFGMPDELTPVLARLRPPPTLHVVEGGDHSFKVPRSRDQADVFRHIRQTVADWIALASVR
jgi:predicted alpha/beta-hydrolase family hydrolase